MKSVIIIIFLFLLTLQSQAQSVDTWEYIELGELNQSVWIRGNDIQNPILLILHGGPGFSESMFFRTYNKELENKFTVVNWDQRGTHLSYHDSIPFETMNIQQFVDDTHQLIEILKVRFNKKKIYLLGHSWGTVIGLNTVIQHPEDLYAYIGVGQISNALKNEKISLNFTIKEAIVRDYKRAIEELREIEKVYPIPGPESLKYLTVQRDWLLEFGGVFWGNGNYSNLFQNVNELEKMYYDQEAAAAGEAYSMKHLWNEILFNVNFLNLDSPLAVPIYFMIGSADYNTPFELTEMLFTQIEAPHKKIYRFSQSGHFIPFEEPEKFHKTMEEILLLQKN